MCIRDSTKRFTREQERSWLFRTVGYGHDALVWKDIVSNLRLEDENALSDFKRILKKNGLERAALSAHGNPVHPDPEIAEHFRQDFQTLSLIHILAVRPAAAYGPLSQVCWSRA